MRDSAIIYRSFYEAIKELPKENQAEVWCAIFEFSLNFNEIELTGLSKTIFTLIKPNLQANIEKWKNGNKPKSKLKKSKTEAKSKQNKSKTEANEDKDKELDKDENVNGKVISPPSKYSFDDFWNKYDKKIDRKAAEEFWKKMPEQKKILAVEQMNNHKAGKDPQYWKAPVRYLRNESWTDAPLIQSKPTQTQISFVPRKPIDND